MKHYLLTLLVTIILFSTMPAQWEILNDGLGYVRDIVFIDENNGWLVSNKLWKTNDNGDTWNKIPLPDTFSVYQLDRLKFTSVHIGWAIDFERGIYKSADGGLSWSMSHHFPDNFLINDIAAINDNIVFVTGIIAGTDYCTGRIYKTDNGGLSWADITPAAPINHIDMTSWHCKIPLLINWV